MSQIQVMVDLETMARATNSVICSIGAVKFSVDAGIIDTFYCTVDAADCKRHGLVVEAPVVNWWRNQPREVLESLRKDTLPLHDALTNFSKWYGSVSLPTWGNSVAFDNVILQSAYEAVGINRRWKHWEDRCYRTMKNIIVIEPDVREGTHHNALDDAVYQTKHLLKILGS